MKQKVTILGAGESGTGAALLAKAKGYDVFVSDGNTIAEKFRQELVANGIDFEERNHSQEKILASEIIIKSPGIPNSVPVVRAASTNNITVIDELEFASRFTIAKIIAITGTNGKTTTTLLTHHLLKEAGVQVGLAGNVGHSLARQVITDNCDYYVVEMSSFQIDGITSFSPDTTILLNITPDHLDRYDYSFDNYIASKFRLVEGMQPDSQLIYFEDDKVITEGLSAREVKSKFYPLSFNNSEDNAAQATGSDMHFNLPSGKFEVKQSDTTLRGKHNIINTMAAVAAVQLAGLEIDQIRNGLKTFVNAPHRMEYVATINQVDFYNDSKATNVDATKYALDSFDEKLVWIAGGVDKGNDYSLLMEQVNAKVKALVCLGEDNKTIREAFHNQILELFETEVMAEAVKAALEYASANDVVLLSPACASFDLFKNYEDRGNCFKEAVHLLKKNYDN